MVFKRKQNPNLAQQSSEVSSTESRAAEQNGTGADLTEVSPKFQPIIPGPRVLKSEEDYDDEPNEWGPPTEYHYKRTPKMIYRLALLRLTDEEIASVFGITVDGFEYWKRTHPPVVKALWKGRDIADAEVVSALRMRAVGFAIPEEQIISRNVKDSNGNESVEIVRVPVTKYYPPDVGAGKMWLSNRQKGKWRETVGLEHSGPNGGDIPIAAKVKPDLSGLSIEELRLAKKILANGRSEEEEQ